MPGFNAQGCFLSGISDQRLVCGNGNVTWNPPWILVLESCSGFALERNSRLFCHHLFFIILSWSQMFNVEAEQKHPDSKHPTQSCQRTRRS